MWYVEEKDFYLFVSPETSNWKIQKKKKKETSYIEIRRKNKCISY